MLALLSLALVVAASGCRATHHDLVAFLDANEHEVSAIEYRVGIPDGITISAPRLLEIDRVTQHVRPDGKIALRLLGPVKVVGLTEKEIAAKLTRLLEPYYEDPKVQVRVTEYRSKVIYLSGQIGSGLTGGGGNAAADRWTSRPYTGRDTVLDVLADTGLSFIAWRSQIHVIRASPNENERHDIIIDVDRMISTGDTSRNVLLQPGDILHVPATPLGWLGLRIQEIMFPFSPVLEAYQLPARVMDASDQYESED
jgi:polysaccharide export outer membrane protein